MLDPRIPPGDAGSRCGRAHERGLITAEVYQLEQRSLVKDLMESVG